MKNTRFALSAILMALVCVIAILALAADGAQAGPLPLPTPVSAPSHGDAGSLIRFFDDVGGITATTSSNPQNSTAYDVMDIQWTVEVPILAYSDPPTNSITATWPATASLTAYYSIDGINWATGPALGSVTTDTTDIAQISVFGRYIKVDVAVSHDISDTLQSSPVTVTVLGIGK